MAVSAILPGQGVDGALRRAAAATGVDYDFLVRTARRESGFDPGAKARTSSAAGLFQFIEQTWLATVKASGAKHGYGQYADLIHRGADGRWRVEGSARNVVLDLRFDARAASLMAGELTSANAAYLRGRTGREPGAGDLYAAHFLGPAGAGRLMEAMATRPSANAVAMFPEAAAANRSIFYRSGQAVSVADLHANLSRHAGGGAPAPVSAAPRAPPSEDEARAMMAARMDRLKQDQTLLALLLGQDGQGSVGFGKAFAPEPSSPT